MNFPYDYRPSNPTTTGIERIPPPKLSLARGVGSRFDVTKSDQVKRQAPLMFDMTEITTEGNGANSIMFEPPIISESFSAKLSISSEIKELLSTDIHFNYILFNILKILNKILDEHGSPGRVEVALESDEDNPKWKHADITVKLDDDSLSSEIWRKTSKEAKEFYKSLEAGKIIPSETIKRIHKFVYIIVD